MSQVPPQADDDCLSKSLPIEYATCVREGRVTMQIEFIAEKNPLNSTLYIECINTVREKMRVGVNECTVEPCGSLPVRIASEKSLARHAGEYIGMMSTSGVYADRTVQREALCEVERVGLIDDFAFPLDLTWNCIECSFAKARVLLR